jgi:hypothetical protein
VSRWFRHYAGMMRDDKLVRVSIRTRQTVERVVWVYAAILESAAEIDDNGRYDFDAAEAAYFLRADEADIHAIEAGLADAGRISSGAVVKWSDRQFKSDRSASRQADYRERKRQQNRGGDGLQESGDAGVTSPSRHRDAPDTETELETEEKKPKAKALVKKRSPIPDDWQPREFAIGSESRKVVDNWPPGEEPAQIEQFIAHHRSKRNTFIDPQDAWSTWVLNTRKWGIGKHERSQQASLSNVVHRILSNGGTDGRAGEDAGPGIANVDERGATRALAARSG